MARTPFTLAAAVSAVAPDAGIIAVAPMTEGASGNIDTVRVTLDDGQHLVVRVGSTFEGAEDLREGTRALSALTPGVRALLPFAAPELRGEVTVHGDTAVVTTFMDGYRVDPAEVPPGPGVGTALAEALAALHGLPTAWVREAGLVVRSADRVRDDVQRLIDRADSTRRTPRVLLARWRKALAHDQLWRFEPTVVLGGASSSSFFLLDREGMPHVTGVVDWHELAVGDPAVDLQWLASAPTAASDVLDAYVAASPRAPDALLRTRARLYAELEFAAWLVHGHDTADDTVVSDAESLLSSLADSVGDEDLVTRAPSGVDGAMALLDRMPETSAAAADTSMHTDVYDPEELATWLPTDESPEQGDAAAESQEQGDAADAAGADRSDAHPEATDLATAPIVLPPAQERGLLWADDEADADEPARAARAAFQRWASSDSE